MLFALSSTQNDPLFWSRDHQVPPREEASQKDYVPLLCVLTWNFRRCLSQAGRLSGRAPSARALLVFCCGKDAVLGIPNTGAPGKCIWWTHGEGRGRESEEEPRRGHS